MSEKYDNDEEIELENIHFPNDQEITHEEFGCSSPFRFFTSEGIKTMQPGKTYDRELNEI